MKRFTWLVWVPCLVAAYIIFGVPFAKIVIPVFLCTAVLSAILKMWRDRKYGLSAFRATFSKSFVDILYEDPYCPKGICYILDSEAIEFVALNNTAVYGNFVVHEPGHCAVVAFEMRKPPREG